MVWPAPSGRAACPCWRLDSVAALTLIWGRRPWHAWHRFRLQVRPRDSDRSHRIDAQAGSGIVLGISLVCVLTTHLGALGYGTIVAYSGWWWFFLLAIYLEAFLAVCCLLGILYGDPGTVKRSPENCLPLPETVVERLQRGESLEGLENLQHEQLGSYCVRCCD